MRETMRDKCNLYADNYLKLKNSFKWEYTVNNRLGALLYTMENLSVDVVRIKNCREIIKENTSIFSYFQSFTSFMVSTMISLKSDSDVKIKDFVSKRAPDVCGGHLCFHMIGVIYPLIH